MKKRNLERVRLKEDPFMLGMDLQSNEGRGFEKSG